MLAIEEFTFGKTTVSVSMSMYSKSVLYDEIINIHNIHTISALYGPSTFINFMF